MLESLVHDNQVFDQVKNLYFSPSILQINYSKDYIHNYKFDRCLEI